MNEALDVARALFAALEAEDWKGAARLFNRVQVEEWYLEFLRSRPREEDFRLEPEQLMKHHPEMPREVAEYQVEEWRKQQHRDPREQFRRSTGDLPPEVAAEAGRHQIGFRHVVLGEVPEADGLRHVVYRRYWVAEDTSGTLYVLSCGKADDGWSVELSMEWTMALSNYSFAAESFEEGEA
jgi:hypothetical protein